jgi:integrase
LASLPQTLSQSEIEQLLEAFPPEIPSHRRGYAMVRCLVDLGLRECEVTNLELDDIDWQAGTLRINKGKARRVDVMPLPHSTGIVTDQCATPAFQKCFGVLTASTFSEVKHNSFDIGMLGGGIGPQIRELPIK